MDKSKKQIISPGLYIVSTPIGNMEDITFRALNILKSSDVILCEDTRRSGMLLSYFEIKKKLIPYHKFNEKKISNNIIETIKNNKVVSMISDAGTPVISDPGLVLVKKCNSENLNVFPVPGPSSITAAISIAGFSENFLFYGFLTKKELALEKSLKNLSILNYSLVFFIPAVKINYYILKFKKYFQDREIVIAREMTKVHEEFIRGQVKTIKEFPQGLKGELTVVLSEKIVGKSAKKEVAESVKMEIKKMLKRYTNKDIVEFISKKENLPKKVIYNLCLKYKKKI
mgnify:CR=1 FL=1|tara:strand:+ start:400 stop:1254 length:855 start_codon:yes stop_codon:yes gene_type:complete